MSNKILVVDDETEIADLIEVYYFNAYKQLDHGICFHP